MSKRIMSFGCLILTLAVLSIDAQANDFERRYRKSSPVVVEIKVDVAITDKKTKAVQYTHLSASGIIITSGGQVLTSDHVIDPVKIAEMIEADLKLYTVHIHTITIFYNNNWYYADVKAADPLISTAFLIMRGVNLNLPHASFGNHKKIKPGSFIYTIANPGGLSNVLRHSIVGTITNQNFNRSYGATKYIISDLEIDSGDSGGPVFDENDQLIGINEWRGPLKGITFIDDFVRSRIEPILRGEIVEKNKFSAEGINDISLFLKRTEILIQYKIRKFHKMPSDLNHGILLIRPHEVGFEDNDIILGINDKPIVNALDFFRTIFNSKPRTKLKFLVMRDFKKVEFETILSTSVLIPNIR